MHTKLPVIFQLELTVMETQVPMHSGQTPQLQWEHIKFAFILILPEISAEKFPARISVSQQQILKTHLFFLMLISLNKMIFSFHPAEGLM